MNKKGLSYEEKKAILAIGFIVFSIANALLFMAISSYYFKSAFYTSNIDGHTFKIYAEYKTYNDSGKDIYECMVTNYTMGISKEITVKCISNVVEVI